VKKFLFFSLIFSFFLSSCQYRKDQTQNITAPENDKKQSEAEINQNFKSKREEAIFKSKALYTIKKEEGVSFLNGPCLSNEIITDWVLDIAHNPRQDIDNKEENQCDAYRSKKAHHFVELDINGNLIRAQ